MAEARGVKLRWQRRRNGCRFTSKPTVAGVLITKQVPATVVARTLLSERSRRRETGRRPWLFCRFSGAGHTHTEGMYKQTVERGLAFLVKQMKVRNTMGDLIDPVEVCTRTGWQDHPLRSLRDDQRSTTFVAGTDVAELHRVRSGSVGGGWRYGVQEPGDTSVVGWQLMACKSGHMAYLRVPRRTILGCTKFLDFVSEQVGPGTGIAAR